MDSFDIKEKIWGGIFGLIAIIAAIAEMLANGISNGSVFGMIKDISGTLIVVIVMIAVTRLLVMKKSHVNFEEELTAALNNWIDKHSNMIVKTSKLPKDHKNDFGMSMTTDISRFYETQALESDLGSGVGRFLRLTQIDKDLYAQNSVQLDFFLNSQTYCHDVGKDNLTELLAIGHNLSSYINGAVDDITVGRLRKESVIWWLELHRSS